MKGEQDQQVKASVGLSRCARSREAGREAALAALATLDGTPPALVIAFASAAHDLPELLAGIRTRTGEAPLVGATGSGIIAGADFTGPDPYVGVLCLGGADLTFGVASVDDLAADPCAAGRNLARAARAAAPAADGANCSLLLLFTDGLAGDQQEVVKGLYSVAGARVPVVGGAASDGYTRTSTSVFRDDRVLRDSAVAVWVRSSRSLAFAAQHGWRPTGLPALVSESSGPVLRGIAGRPAKEYYVEQLSDAGVELGTGDQFGGTAMEHPIGLLQSDGTYLVRSLLAEADDGALLLLAPVPAGASVQIMSGDADSLLDGAAELGERLRAEAPDAAALLVFSCAARRAALGDRVHEEAVRLAGTSTVPTLGFYTYGEFCRGRGVQGFHNATLAGVAL